MRHPKQLFAVAAMILFCGLCSLAAEIKIVANPSVKPDFISVAEIRSVFMADRNSLKDGSHVEPVFEQEGATHEAFLREYLKETNEALQTHYGALVFTGKSAMPKSFRSDAEVVAYVAHTRGAIGYVSASAATEGVKVLDVVSEGAGAERRLLTRVEPEYPETLRALHITGTVRLEITISPQGSVETVSVVGGNPILSDSAIKAVKQWVYAAGPTRTKMQVSLSFDSPR
jgi:TonB family protein